MPYKYSEMKNKLSMTRESPLESMGQIISSRCPIKVKFYVAPPWERGTKVCINDQDHMTKMAATPIYGKNL